jgi:hypothetical protein
MLLGVLIMPSISMGQDQCDGVYGNGPNRFSLATGSPGELGLVKALAEAFSSQTNTTLCWKKAGSRESLKPLKDKKAKFFSRGDNSGTHKKEMNLWQKANVTPSGDWYIVTKDFMAATLKRANDENG